MLESRLRGNDEIGLVVLSSLWSLSVTVNIIRRETQSPTSVIPNAKRSVAA